MSESPLDTEDYRRLTGFEGEWRDSWWNLDFLELIAKRLCLRECADVLDLGCGVGHWGRTLAKVLPNLASLTGVDIEPNFLETARERAPRGFRYLLGSAEKLPLEDESVDLVTCQTVLIHVPDAKVALEEMKRVLRPGGLLLAAEPNNVASSYTILGGQPELPWDLLESWIRFQHLCEKGKRALVEGDSSVGERLPGLVNEAGFEEIRVAVNEKTPVLFPPYESAEQKVEYDQFLEWISGQDWLGFGTKENSRRYFLASGQDESNFQSHWDKALEVQRRVREALKSRTFSGGRCPNFYLISGRKSFTQTRVR